MDKVLVIHQENNDIKIFKTLTMNLNKKFPCFPFRNDWARLGLDGRMKDNDTNNIVHDKIQQFGVQVIFSNRCEYERIYKKI
jgi:hypothetical protein